MDEYSPYCIGLSYRNAPVEIREKVSFSSSNIRNVIAILFESGQIKEAAIVSTCNRVEIYAIGKSHAEFEIRQFFHRFHKIADESLSNYLYCIKGAEVTRHLFRVAASLESQIIGEPQILGQIKSAYKQAFDAKSIGSILHLAFSRAIIAAKRVRSETHIGQGSLSIGCATVSLAEKVLGNLKGVNCLLVGAGKMSELAAKNFANRGARLFLANRSEKSALVLSQKLNEATAHSLEELPQLLALSDVAVVSTAAPDYLITQELVRKVLRSRRFKPLLFIDISVPRNVDPAIANIENAYVYDIDDLSQTIEKNTKIREAEKNRAELIIEEELNSYVEKIHELKLNPLIKELTKTTRFIVNIELKKTLAIINSEITITQKNYIESMVNSIANKILHQSINNMKQLYTSTHISTLQLDATAKRDAPDTDQKQLQ